ncbi:HAF family repeat protein [Frankia torreyi]|uniref:HAF family repeat protein n=1 Tax=Frankia torreyi TaxID=1856 RepID=A0A0D8B8K3_9ACTN|nr:MULTISPECIES: HAF repeat-containing protein [Frankia]KJE20435.1 HAF family repeat protein [Frankia torreyi]KQC36176.1 twin-arginine translocation pathway signal protein [Frankia sp. ACN1ag]KQM02773.1 HAF family repeat protein [Frankia sp. CpI1-P]
MPNDRRTFIRLAALAGATAPLALGAVTPVAAATGDAATGNAPAAVPLPRSPLGRPPVLVPGPNSYSAGRLRAGNAAGLLAGSWDDSPYSAIGGIWRDGTVHFLDGSNDPAAVNEAGVVVGDVVSHYDRQAFRWFNGNYQRLGFLGGTNTIGGYRSSANAVNRSGAVVGYSSTDSGAQHAALWWDPRPQDLGTLGGPSSEAVDVNAAGHIVGSSATAAGQSHAVVWFGGAIHDLGTLGGSSSTAVAVNERGQIVGHSETADGHRRAALWDRGRAIDLGTLPGDTTSSAVAINNAGQVLVSSYGTTNGAFLWQAGRRTPLRVAGGAVEPVDLNDRGVACGTVTASADGTTRAFRWQAGRLTQLATLGGSYGNAWAVTPTGIIVGSSRSASSPVPQAVFWPAPGR